MKNFIKGIAIGIATLVPGVSGGTMSLVLGIYDDLIHAVGSFFENWKKHSKLLIQIGLGVILAFALFSNIISFALDKIPMEMGFFFLGVILGGIPVLYKKASLSKGSTSDIILLFIGFVLVLLMSGDSTVSVLSNSTGIVNMVLLLLAGIIIAVALILPGISGSFMLLALGLYDITLESIKTFNIPFLIPLGLGVILGTLATTKTIEGLLNKYPRKTYMLILGFVIGSAIPVFPGVPNNINIITSIISLVLGFLIIFYLSKKEI